MAYGRPLPRPTNYTPELTLHAKTCLERIYRKGPAYKKAGVMLYELTAEEPGQGHLFEERSPDEAALMEVMDQVNSAMGKNTLHSAATGTQKKWRMHEKRRSPRRATRWSELPVARI